MSKDCQMGFCRNLHRFYLEGEETLRKISICSLYLQSLTGEAPTFLDWGLTECFGDSQGVTGSALWAEHARYGSCQDPMLYHVGRQPKVKFEASIPSRNFNTFKKKNQNKTHNIQNLLFSSSACGLPCVRRQRWKCTGYAILIPVITERSPELSQFHAQNSLFKTLILFPDFLFSDFFCC